MLLHSCHKPEFTYEFQLIWCFPKPQSDFLALRGCVNADGYIRVNSSYQLVDSLGSAVPKLFAGGDVIWMESMEQSPLDFSGAATVHRLDRKSTRLNTSN